MSKTINVSDSVTLYPSSFDSVNSSYSSVYNSLEPSNGLTAADSNTRTCVYSNTTANSTSVLWYNFDCSGVPEGATITSVSCRASAACYNRGSYFTIRNLQLFVGTTVAKGNPVTITGSGGTAAQHTLDCGNSWTRSDLDNLKIRIFVQRGTQTSDASFSFWGATLTINYTISGIAYTIGATSNISGITVEPTTQEKMNGTSATVSIYASSLEDVSITDNDTDITDRLEQHAIPTGASVNRDLGSYTLVSGGFNGQGASYFQGLVGKGVNNTKTTSSYYSSGNGTIAVFTYDMSFTDIPSNATITSVYCEVNGHAESTSNNNEYMCVRLISGNTNLTNELNFKSIGTSNSTQTLTCNTLPTVAQLASMKLQCRLGYYGGAINGATCYVEYDIPGSGGYYWTYTIENLSADHVILIDEAGVYIPPEEDPQYTYQSLTISSINATTDPWQGTTRVITGSNQIITISPTDPQLTLALDNGVDITSQLVGGIPQNTYTVTTQVSGADYGFYLNSSTGYYVSSNDNVNKSASVARLNLNFESDCLVTINYINYAEENYDYGMFGKLDTAVATDGLTAGSSSSYPSDSTGNYQLAMCANLSSVQTITYEVPAGEHFIDIKYGKDDASSSGNDNLQWKVANIEATSASGEYTYTLNNITEKHSLIFIFGDVTYYFITSSGNCKLFPDGQSVVLPGDNYKINIIPNNITDTVTITDNGNDVTSMLEREDGYDKNNNPAVSYKYSLSNIQTAHTLVISCTAAGQQDSLFFKYNNNWIQVIKVWVKKNNVWEEEKLTYISDEDLRNIRKG